MTNVVAPLAMARFNRHSQLTKTGVGVEVQFPLKWTWTVDSSERKLAAGRNLAMTLSFHLSQVFQHPRHCGPAEQEIPQLFELQARYCREAVRIHG
jgi:hypothetical protein